MRGDLAVVKQGQWLTNLPVGASITQAKLLYWGLLRKKVNYMQHRHAKYQPSRRLQDTVKCSVQGSEIIARHIPSEQQEGRREP